MEIPKRSNIDPIAIGSTKEPIQMNNSNVVILSDLSAGVPTGVSTGLSVKAVAEVEVKDLRATSRVPENECTSTCTEVRKRKSLPLTVLTIALFLAPAVSGFAQSITPEVISAGGGDSSNVNASLSWTIGEPVSETFSGTNATVTQGFHQEHYEVISIEEHRELGYDIRIYPNPSTDFIIVELSFIGKLPVSAKTEFKIVLTDHAGKTLMNKSIKNKLEYSMSMQDYAAGQYFLKITGAEGNLYKSAQIIKLK